MFLLRNTRLSYSYAITFLLSLEHGQAALWVQKACSVLMLLAQCCLSCIHSEGEYISLHDAVLKALFIGIFFQVASLPCFQTQNVSSFCCCMAKFGHT